MFDVEPVKFLGPCCSVDWTLPYLLGFMLKKPAWRWEHLLCSSSFIETLRWKTLHSCSTLPEPLCWKGYS